MFFIQTILFAYFIRADTEDDKTYIQLFLKDLCQRFKYPKNEPGQVN